MVILAGVCIDPELKPDPRNDAILVWAPAIDLSDGKGKHHCTTIVNLSTWDNKQEVVCTCHLSDY